MRVKVEEPSTPTKNIAAPQPISLISSPSSGMVCEIAGQGAGFQLARRCNEVGSLTTGCTVSVFAENQAGKPPFPLEVPTSDDPTNLKKLVKKDAGKKDKPCRVCAMVYELMPRNSPECFEHKEDSAGLLKDLEGKLKADPHNKQKAEDLACTKISASRLALRRPCIRPRF